jgi:ESCRT-II complex subunit VPS22
MALPDLLVAVRKRRGSAAPPVSEDDVLRAISQLRALGGGWAVITVGGTRCVRSVPVELDGDATALLGLAAAATPKGVLTAAQAAQATGWAAPRVATALEALLQDGLAMVDDGGGDGVRRFWFPALALAEGG